MMVTIIFGEYVTDLSLAMLKPTINMGELWGVMSEFFAYKYTPLLP